MSPIYDQLNRTIHLTNHPQRIISVVPSQTELLYDLGLDHEVAGITKFCVHPKHWYQTKPRVGGTKKLNLDFIRQLHPDLILANKEENTKSDIEELEKDYPVWISDINNLSSAIGMIRTVGEITGTLMKAERIIRSVETEFVLLEETFKMKEKKQRVIYLIWQKPYMAVGKGTFIDDMLSRCGLENAVTMLRYPELDHSQLRDIAPDLLLLSSEPFPFNEKHVEDLKRELPESHVMLADGEMFSWYGSRLTIAPAYFRKLFS